MKKKGGYGVVYQDVMRNKSLSPEAKAIYAYLSSIAGSGDSCYPSVEVMQKELSMSKNRLMKHMGQLIAFGVVEKVRERNGNIYGRNVYKITHEVEVASDLKRIFEAVEIRAVENEATNNNNTNNNTIKNNNNNIISSEPDKPTPNPSGILLPLNDKTFYDVPLEKIASWAEAYPAVEVKVELKRMIVWLDSNPTKRKTRRGIERFINNWLARTQDSGGTRGKEVNKQSGGNAYNTDQDWEDIKRAIAKATEGKEPGENIFA